MSPNKVLHLCNDYLGSNVHKNLYKKLSEKGIKQVVFCPLRKHTSNKIDSYESSYQV